MIECTAEVVSSRSCEITLRLPNNLRESLEMLGKKLKDNRVTQVYIKLGYPRRPVSRGERGQLNRIHGQCQDLATQLSDGVKMYTKEEVKAAMKRMAVSIGYRTKFNDIDGIEEPISLTEATMEEAGFVTTTINRFADAHDLWLTEYDDSVKPPVKYRSLHGRTREEMIKLREINDGNETD